LGNSPTLLGMPAQKPLKREKVGLAWVSTGEDGAVFFDGRSSKCLALSLCEGIEVGNNDSLGNWEKFIAANCVTYCRSMQIDFPDTTRLPRKT
jgi:hypothetical protein